MAEEKKKNVLFEIINALFNDKQYISNLSKESMKQNCFMINRRIAIKFPLQAQVFNSNKVNESDVIKFWSDFLYNGGRPPGWVYTAGATKSQNKKLDKNKLTSQMIKAYCKKNNLSKKDYDAAMRFYPEELINEIVELDNINKLLNSYEKDN